MRNIFADVFGGKLARNFLTPTKKPIGRNHNDLERRKRRYDTPATPLDRLLAAGVISPVQKAELIAYRDSLNPAALAREITYLQDQLTTFASEKTEQLLELATAGQWPTRDSA